MNKVITDIAEDYFKYMAENFPVMCSEDEFYLFPRTKEAFLFLDRLDVLQKDNITQHLSYVKKLLKKIEKLKLNDFGLDETIDTQLLKQSMNSFIMDFELTKIWCKDPSIYIKIFILGIDQIVSKLSLARTVCLDALASRIKKGIYLLKEAQHNLSNVPTLYKNTTMEIIASSISYLKKELNGFLKDRLPEKHYSKLIKDAIRACEEFKLFLVKQSSQDEYIKDRGYLENLLKNNYSYGERSLEEIFNIACEEHRSTLKEMRRISSAMKPSRKWQGVVSKYYLKIDDPEKLLGTYSKEIDKLKDFLTEKDVLTIPQSQEIFVRQTPRYLKPIRQTASYNSPLTKDRRERAFFYVTVDLPIGNIHDEYIFVTAHETYPGHHLLDAKRRALKNSIRCNTESALFYEGWASYSERLIDELEYIKTPEQNLIGLKRQAWRAVRAMLDVGLRTKKYTLDDAASALVELGYDQGMVLGMVKHYALTCGYQLCYTIGKFEFENLKTKFMPKLGMKKFHDLVLSEGEIPFDLLEKKLEEASIND